MADSPFDRLCERLGEDFPAIRDARQKSSEACARLRGLARNGGVTENHAVVTPPDTTLVVFGSLARGDFTAASDTDWTLLIDSPADPHHRSCAHEFDQRVAGAGFTKPGPAGVFGSMSFSHDLVHKIGGEHDSNTNLTQRVLLLFESASIARPEVHMRVVRNVLRRYIDYERSFLADTGRKYKVPRFLLNDLVRFWRTMAVDYVCKRWERGDEGWALRNMKLRFSRKLLFVSGLLTCFSCYLDKVVPREERFFRDQQEAARQVLGHMAGKLMAPLEVLSDVLANRTREETALRVLRAYDCFTEAMGDDRREHLASLSPEASYADVVFNELRTHSHDFNAGLTAMFHDDDRDLAELMRKYGAF